MPTLKSTTKHTFGGKKLKRGDKFEANDREAKLVIALGRAKPYQTRVMRPRKEASTGQPPALPVVDPPAGDPAFDPTNELGSHNPDPGGESISNDNAGETERRDMKADLE